MTVKNISIPRRTFLRGTGAAIALPLLDAMQPALAKAATPPVRLGFVYVPNGLILHEFLPKTEGRGFDMPRILAPLTPYREYVSVVSGLANAAGDALEASSGGHARGSWCWLSGRRAKRTDRKSVV